jgi:alkylation response protein AidB-like acyl-CoA dehydrogenase
MDLSLSDEQEFLREAARGALSRIKSVEAAREALEGYPLPDLWPLAVEAGWPGLLVDEEHGGAGLGVFEATLVAEETGRGLSSVPLISHLQATSVLNAAGHDALAAFAAGEERVAYVAARPPGGEEDEWTIEPESGLQRAPLPAAVVEGTQATVTGVAPWVIDAPGADRFLVPAQSAYGDLIVVLLDASAVEVEAVTRYDATRSLGHVTFSGAAGDVIHASSDDLARAWYLGQALIAAESLGSVETILDVALTYAKERFTFGRTIGSYQAIKHGLVEILRNRENTRSLLYWAGYSAADVPEEFALAASSARTAAGKALDHAARQNIVTHGGIGATWEHDAPLFFRRAQLSRRLLGGTGDAADRVAGELIAASA